MRRTFLTFAAVAVMVLAGCTNDPPAPIKPTEPATSRVPGTAAPPSVQPTSEAPGSVPASQPKPACSETQGWNTKPDRSDSPTLVTGQLSDVRPGRHDCFDRVVFDVDTTKNVGFSVRYVPVVRQDGSGFPVKVAGGAALEVVIYAPAPDLFNGYGYGAEWPALREIKFAGTFEGQTTFAIGVKGKTPFAASIVRKGGVTSVVVGIAH